MRGRGGYCVHISNATLVGTSFLTFGLAKYSQQGFVSLHQVQPLVSLQGPGWQVGMSPHQVIGRIYK